MTDRRLRVLVVDDSPLFRRAVARALGGLPDVDLLGTATDGQDALDKILQLAPDLITLDLEMPGMDGLTLLRALREQRLKTRVLMLSAHGGEKRTVEALCLGAEDYLLKPRGGAAGSQKELQELLRTKLGQFNPSPRPLPVRPPDQRGPGQPRRFQVGVTVVGVSTGGPNALAELLNQFRRPLRVPLLIVQHMPATFTPLLAERLNDKALMPVREVRDGERLLPGQVYLGPGNYHFEVRGPLATPTARLTQGPLENGCRPAADVLFRSAAQLFGAGCLAVVMTGMGKDGLAGCQAVFEAGGCCLAQDRESSVIWGMPRSVIESGLAREIHLERLGSQIEHIVEWGHSHSERPVH